MGEWGLAYPPGLLLLSEYVMPEVSVVDILRLELVVVLPHPRYPLSSSAMARPPTAGRVGSWLGLKPYSSTSFLRSSSALLRCLRFRQKKMPPSTNSATTTTGMTTAMAVLPPLLMPPLSSFCAFCRPVELVLDESAPVAVEDAPFVGAATLPDGVMIEVMVMTWGGWPGAVADVTTTIEVWTAVEGGAEGAVTVLVPAGGGGALLVEGAVVAAGGGGALVSAAGGGALVFDVSAAGGGADEGARAGAGAGEDSGAGAGAGALEGAGWGVEGGGLVAGLGAEGELEARAGLEADCAGALEGAAEAGVGAEAAGEGCGAVEGVTDGGGGGAEEGEEGGGGGGAEGEAEAAVFVARGAEEAAAAGLDATKESDNVLAVTLPDMFAMVARPEGGGHCHEQKSD